MAAKVELQKFEDRAALRIKFASVRDQGPRLVSDALEEYEGFYDELPAGWSVTEEGQIETLTEYWRSARRLSSSDGDIVMVEHETGLEILVMSVGLAETAAKLVSWGWKKWKHRRETKRETMPPGGALGNDAVVFERTTWAADGTRMLNRVTVPAGQVNDDLILRYMTGGAPQAT